MTTEATTKVYRHVIDDVIRSVRPEFQSEGVDEAVLQQLQQLWETKLLQTGAIGHAPLEGSSARNVAPDSGGRVQTRIPAATSGYGKVNYPGNQYQVAPAPRAYAHQYNSKPTVYQYAAPKEEDKYGKPEPYMAQPSGGSRGVDINEPYLGEEQNNQARYVGTPQTQDFLGSAEKKRKRNDTIPQLDGAGDSAEPSDSLQTGQSIPCWTPDVRPADLRERERARADALLTGLMEKVTPSTLGAVQIPQVDGGPDEYDEGVEDYNDHETEDYNVATPAPPAAPAEVPAEEDPGADLGTHDDDDELDGDDDQDEELETKNLVLAQFDKVTRTKNKWKCTLKDGVMHINDHDVLFLKANGEFEW